MELDVMCQNPWLTSFKILLLLAIKHYKTATYFNYLFVNKLDRYHSSPAAAKMV